MVRARSVHDLIGRLSLESRAIDFHLSVIAKGSLARKSCQHVSCSGFLDQNSLAEMQRLTAWLVR